MTRFPAARARQNPSLPRRYARCAPPVGINLDHPDFARTIPYGLDKAFSASAHTEVDWDSKGEPDSISDRIKEGSVKLRERAKITASRRNLKLFGICAV
jgi:hypothetical protein